MKKFCKLATCLLVVGFVFICGVFAQDGNTEKSPVAGKRYEDPLGHKIEFSEEGNRFRFRNWGDSFFGTYVFDGVYDKAISYKLEYENKGSSSSTWLTDDYIPSYAPRVILASGNNLVVGQFDDRMDKSYKYVGDAEILRNKLAGTTQKDGKLVFTKNTVKVNAYKNPIYDYEWSVDTLCYKISGYPPTDDIEKFLGYVDIKALKELKAETENEMTYEKAFWIYLMSEYGDKIFEDKKSQELYFRTYHTKEYEEIKKDQFALYDKLSKVKSEMQQKYDEKAPSKDDVYSVRTMGEFGNYDFDKNQFVINAKARPLHLECKIPNPFEGLKYQDTMDVYLSGAKIFDDVHGFWETGTIMINYPVDIEKARELDKKTVLLVVYYKPDFQRKGSYNRIYSTMLSYELYDSPETMVKLK